jgi:hypothetical protein
MCEVVCSFQQIRHNWESKNGSSSGPLKTSQIFLSCFGRNLLKYQKAEVSQEEGEKRIERKAREQRFLE